MMPQSKKTQSMLFGVVAIFAATTLVTMFPAMAPYYTTMVTAISGIVGSHIASQGFADGLSKGATSSTANKKDEAAG